MMDNAKIDAAQEKLGELRALGNSMISGSESLSEDDVSWLGLLIGEIAESGRKLLSSEPLVQE